MRNLVVISAGIAAALTLVSTRSLAIETGTTSLSNPNNCGFANGNKPAASAASIVTALGSDIIASRVSYIVSGTTLSTYYEIWDFNTSHKQFCVSGNGVMLECGDYSGTIGTTGGTQFSLQLSCGSSFTGSSAIIGN